jgi:hypothetical protein
VSNFNILVAGRGGGFLKYPGIHFRGNGQNTSDVLLSAMQAAGTGVTSVGAGVTASSSPCTGIHA